jgi:hypothetical protein
MQEDISAEDWGMICSRAQIQWIQDAGRYFSRGLGYDML